MSLFFIFFRRNTPSVLLASAPNHRNIGHHIAAGEQKWQDNDCPLCHSALYRNCTCLQPVGGNSTALAATSSNNDIASGSSPARTRRTRVGKTRSAASRADDVDVVVVVVEAKKEAQEPRCPARGRKRSPRARLFVRDRVRRYRRRGVHRRTRRGR